MNPLKRLIQWIDGMILDSHAKALTNIPIIRGQPQFNCRACSRSDAEYFSRICHYPIVVTFRCPQCGVEHGKTKTDKPAAGILPIPPAASAPPNPRKS